MGMSNIFLLERTEIWPEVHRTDWDEFMSSPKAAADGDGES